MQQNKDIISIQKFAALNADEDSDMELLHPTFFVLSIELSQRSVIFSSDGKSVLACSKPLAKVGEVYYFLDCRSVNNQAKLMFTFAVTNLR